MRIQQVTKLFIAASSSAAVDTDPKNGPADIFVNDELVGTAWPLLVDRRLRDRSFIYWFPRPLQPGDVVQIRPQRLENPENVLASVYKEPAVARAGDTAALLALPDWAIDRIDIAGGIVRFFGWILLSSGREFFDIFVNGRLVKKIRLLPEREDVANAWRPAKLGYPSFSFEAEIELATDQRSLEFSLAEDGRSQTLNNYWFPIGPSKFPLPDEGRRLRVMGSTSESVFLRHGFTAYQRLNAVIRKFSGFEPGNRRQLLDWGCGCASIGRYFIGDDKWSYTGVDIDPDNIAWCRNNISAASFEAGPLQPPTRFPDGLFDVAFGVSVFTHLQESDQLLWLKELSRIISPRGIGIFTIHGSQAVAKDERLLSDGAFSSSGFAFSQDDHEIGKMIGNKSYYGIAFHHFGYVSRVWSDFFDLLAYIPAGFSHQDVIVVRPRK